MAEGGDWDQDLARAVELLDLNGQSNDQAMNGIELIVQIYGESTTVTCHKFDGYYYISASQEGGRKMVLKVTLINGNTKPPYVIHRLCASPPDYPRANSTATMIQSNLELDRTVLLFLKLTTYEQPVIMELTDVLKTLLHGL